MKKYISWNNRRRDCVYWFALGLQIVAWLDVSQWYESDEGILYWIKTILETFYKWIIPDGLDWRMQRVLLLMCSCFTFYFCVIGMIMLLNHWIGSLPDSKGEKRLLQFTTCTAFAADVILGAVLEILVIASLCDVIKRADLGALLLMIVCGCGFFGSVLYWLCVFPFWRYSNILSILRRAKGRTEQCWYCLNNGEDRFSTLACMPGKVNAEEIIVDVEDLQRIREAGKSALTDTDFVYFLVMIDQNSELSEAFIHQVQHIVNIPHSIVLACFLGEEKNSPEAEKIRHLLSQCSNVRVEDHLEYTSVRELDIEKILINSRLRTKKNHRIPLQFIEDEQLLQTYLDMGRSPKICLDFLKIIIHRLETLPGIYALFDLIDLQYRIIIACYVKHTTDWLAVNSQSIGNVGEMAELIECSVIEKNYYHEPGNLPTEKIFQKIISDKDMKLLRKYLPNYEIDSTKPGYYTIVYLTTALRNVLRGHGYFDITDAESLFELVFKIMLMNACILSIDELSITSDSTREWDDKDYYTVVGEHKNQGPRRLSPFLVASKDGNILVFNNWYRGSEEVGKVTIEYINYLNGTLISPEFKNVDCDIKNNTNEERITG